MLAHVYSADASHKVIFFRKQTSTCLRPLYTLGPKNIEKKKAGLAKMAFTMTEFYKRSRTPNRVRKEKKEPLAKTFF